MTGVHRSEAWLQAQFQRTGKLIAEGAVQAMERELGKLKGGDRHVTGELSGNAVAGAAHPTKRGMNEGEKNAKVGDGYPAGSIPEPTKRGMNGLGRLRKRKGPNKTEAAFGVYLNFEADYEAMDFEAITLRMPGGTTYTPDWPAEDNYGVLCFFEVKGHMREAARVRLKEFAAYFACFRFFLVRANDRRLLSWDIREVGQ